MQAGMHACILACVHHGPPYDSLAREPVAPASDGRVTTVTDVPRATRVLAQHQRRMRPRCQAARVSRRGLSPWRRRISSERGNHRMLAHTSASPGRWAWELLRTVQREAPAV